MIFLKRAKFLFKRGDELDEIIQAEDREEKRKAIEATMHNLNLCKKHKQEHNHSEFAESNCDHCNMLLEIDSLKSRLKIAEVK